MTEYLRLEDLLALCSDLGELAVRDVGLLDGAAQRPATSLFGRDAYPGIHDKAAVLLESIARHHALVDGNKRLSWLATVVFYGLNDLILDAPEDDAYRLMVAVASGITDWRQTAIALAGWTRPADTTGGDP